MKTEADYKRQVRRAIKRQNYRYPINIEAAVKALRFVENLRHTKGQWWGKPFVLADWQAEELIIPIFGTLQPDGLRQYRIVYIEVPRKNGKSEIAAAIALYLLFADNEMSAEIYGAAADRDQAAIVFNVAAQMVNNEPELLKRSRVYTARKRIIVPKTDSFYHAISSEAASKHGYNAHGIIFDELHAQRDRELWDVLTTSQGTRTQPLIVAITTAGYDRTSICYEQHEYAQKVLKGIVEDPRYFAYISAAPDDADWTDPKVWSACNPALGDFRDSEELEALFKRAKETPALENVFRRLYLNQWTTSETRFIALHSWDACDGKVDPNALKTMSCFGGLDLSKVIDITALLLTFPVVEKDADDEDIIVYKTLPYFWLPEADLAERCKKDQVPYDVWARQGFIELTPGEVIDYAWILKRLEELRKMYQIEEIAFDRWGAQQLATQMDDMGLTVVPFGQGFASMSAPTKDLESLVLEGRIHHGGNPVLRWMADNLMVKQDPAGNLKPDKSSLQPRQKIDGMVALIMSLDCAIRNKDKYKPSVYNTRGIRAL